jgi:hypothetical protein
MGQVRCGSQIFVNTPFGQPPMVQPHQTLVLTLAAQIDGRARSQFSETRVRTALLGRPCYRFDTGCFRDRARWPDGLA